MRVIAERAGFVTKMEYASDQPVSNVQLLNFLQALQHQHHISYMPSVEVGEIVTRIEYLTILYKLFVIERQDRTSRPTSEEPTRVHNTTTSETQTIISNPTFDLPQELKNEFIDYIVTTWSDNATGNVIITGNIGLNTNAIDLTWKQIQQWLGRS